MMNTRIAVNTGGGDAPGLNAVIRAATVAASRPGWEVQAWAAMIEPDSERCER